MMQPTTFNDRPRRVLVVGENSSPSLQRADASSYEILTATGAMMLRAISESMPDAVIIALQPDENGEGASLALARRLRTDHATYALPLMFAWSTDELGMRNAALSIGADDYFSLATPADEVLARLDALFWRMEAGRRAGIVIGDPRLEIDTFVLLLDSVREDLHAGVSGTLALVCAMPRQGESEGLGKAARDRTLAEAQGFLKLNLRRTDAVAFYGPTLLMIHMPRMSSHSAVHTLTRLREEFLADRADNDLAIGLASFPEDGNDVESLIKKVEMAANIARAGSSATRVIAHQAQAEMNAPSPIVGHEETSEPALVRESRQFFKLPVINQEVEKQSSGAINDTKNNASKVADEVVGASEVVSSNEVVSVSTASVHVAAHQANESKVTTATLVPARQHELRASGDTLPRRLLLTVSNAARMAQLNSLIRAAGYEARAAFDGQQALDLLRIERPDLLLLDYELHSFNGIEMLRRLCKQQGGHISLPVVLLLSPENESTRSEALEMGVRAVVALPYDPAELLDSMRLAGSI